MSSEKKPETTLASPSFEETVIEFWFGELDNQGGSDALHTKRWWSKDPALDAEIREKFASLFAVLMSGSEPQPSWVSGARGLLAAVIVLDQFPRNMFRDTAGMYAGDARARQIVFEIIALGYDKQLPFALRTFVYMPLMHSERLEDQVRCVELFESLADELEGEAKTNANHYAGYAVSHRDIVARFGRFPHRNHILGRESTPLEVEFLKTPGSGF